MGSEERGTSARSRRKGRWRSVGAPEDFPAGAARALKLEGQQLVVGRTEQGDLFALEGRCPHEGYPLAQGELDGAVLTCAWHNWKFAVATGRCVFGGEDVRAFDLRLHRGEVQVDLAEPDEDELRARLRESFRCGLYEHENGRAIRDGVRLLQAGYEPWSLLIDTVLYDAQHAEDGTTHVLALAADCGRLLERYPGPEAMYPIAPVIDLCGETNMRLPRRELAAPIEEGSHEQLEAAVEERDVERAEGLLLGAFRGRGRRAKLESWLFRSMARHFTDFGHQLIYLVKAQELLEHAPPEAARELYAALLRNLVLATREDTLPYMKQYVRRWSPLFPELEEVHAAARPDAPFDYEGVRDAVLDGPPKKAFGALWKALREGVPAARAAEALVAAAAHRFLRFDVAIDEDPELAENWLWATHRLTFASAVRKACERFDEPAALRFLLQALAFVHSGARLDAPPDKRVELEEAPAVDAPGPERVVAAIRAKDTRRALREARALLAQEGAAGLRVALEDLCLDAPLVRPIVVAHAIKTTCAAFDEHEALAGRPDRDVPVLAAVRFLASPIAERRIPATVFTSLRWVVDGKGPRKLTQ